MSLVITPQMARNAQQFVQNALRKSTSGSSASSNTIVDNNPIAIENDDLLDSASSATSLDPGLVDDSLWKADDAFKAAQASAQAAMNFEAEQAQINRDWQKMMSDTSYQRAVADLKAAGLNPILAVSGLSGATTPAGSSASGYAASAHDDSRLMSSFITTLGQLISTVLSGNSKQVVAAINAASRR